MKFLHSGDWHLGKTLYDVSMKDDQNHFLNQIFEIFDEAKKSGKPYDALVIPGDIYDRAIPSVEAVGIFNGFLNTMNDRFPEVHIFILAGNHDGPERLGFAAEFLSKANIHIQTDAKKLTEAVVVNGTAVYQIPFLMPGSFHDDTRRSQNELYEKATELIKEAHEKKYKGLPILVCAHATVYGCSDPENVLSIGTASSINPDLFSDFTYTALGHIHKYQKLNKENKMFYSGSPIAYSFDDNSEKFFLSVEIENDIEKPSKVERIPVNLLHPVVRLHGKFNDFYNSDDYAKYAESYVEIKCTDNTISENPKQLLKAKYPHLLSFVRAKLNSMEENENFNERKKIMNENTGTSELELFKKFLENMYSTQDDEDSKKKKIEIVMRSNEEKAAEIELFGKTLEETRK